MILVLVLVCPTVFSAIHMEKQTDGVWILEDNRKIFFYRTDGSTGPLKEAGRNHYIHPLMAPDGVTELTLDAPSDHLHHRGLYWGWSEIFAHDKKVADGWKLKDITWQIKSVVFEPKSNTLEIKVNWLTGKTKEAIIAEYMRIKVSDSNNGEQNISFTVDLTALVDGVSIAGVQNSKGYGGFSARLINTRDLSFESDGKSIKATKDHLEAGASLTFQYSADSGLPNLKVSCAAQDKPVNKWILRNNKSMQNCVWPGREHLPLEKGEVTSIAATITLSQGSYIND
ncbi:DUF6807 family protein [Thalassotalea psychrophila]|uniref:DUF6807 family protein n=1 Tax=Thalassotalea psychrophila TaxID=3065647 RepID=A0ABY9TWA6_9GAMM|nr:DUF6807 family protein [Colwelliaceae bacterium SQ149]